LQNWRIDAPKSVPTQTPIEPKRAVDPAGQQKIPRVEVYWHTVTYKTVAIYAFLAVAIIFAGIYIVSPNFYSNTIHKISTAIDNGDSESIAINQTQAKFVNLDGKVQVKKVNSVQWVEADFHTTLDKGDLVQTGPEGVARITFGDGTFYTVKSDTLITVEENSMASNKPTSVAVRINTGSVDLATPNWASPDSKAAVSVEDSTAQLRSNSRAAVKADPEKKESEIVMARGSAEVQRGVEKIELAQWQKATLPVGGPITKTDVLAPPDLVEPLNLAPIIGENPKGTNIHFEWKPVQNAVSYTLRISTTSMFTKAVKTVTVAGTSAEINGLDAGDYFWSVTATDQKKQSSEVSEIYKFTLVAQGKTQEMALEVDSTQLHGRVVEIIGRTEPGAALIVNGQPVPNISPDGTFRHFTPPLMPGEHTIVVIGQNRRGGTAKQTVSIVVPR
jgi:FecR protein